MRKVPFAYRRQITVASARADRRLKYRRGTLDQGKARSVHFALTYIWNILAQRVVLLLFAFMLALAAACGGAPEGAVSGSCGKLENVTGQTGLISRSEAEELATKWLSMSAPEISGTEIERVWASCLTTLRSYEQGLLQGQGWTNPEVRSPDTPVWIVEVKGISRNEGISTRSVNEPYQYAIQVINAGTAESIAGSRSWEPLLEPQPVKEPTRE